MRPPSALVRHTAFAVALPFWTAACGSAATEPGGGLEAARARWARSGPAAYHVTIARACECLPEMSGPVVVTVRNGVVTERRYAASGAAVVPTYAALFPAVEGLFALVDAGVRSGARPLDARYDPTFGYPTRVVVGDPATDAPVTSVSGFGAE